MHGWLNPETDSRQKFEVSSGIISKAHLWAWFWTASVMYFGCTAVESLSLCGTLSHDFPEQMMVLVNTTQHMPEDRYAMYQGAVVGLVMCLSYLEW